MTRRTQVNCKHCRSFRHKSSKCPKEIWKIIGMSVVLLIVTVIYTLGFLIFLRIIDFLSMMFLPTYALWPSLLQTIFDTCLAVLIIILAIRIPCCGDI